MYFVSTFVHTPCLDTACFGGFFFLKKKLFALIDFLTRTQAKVNQVFFNKKKELKSCNPQHTYMTIKHTGM